jgi:hypothetical protein
MIRELLARLGFVELVWLRDFDGEIVIRMLRHRGPFLVAIRVGPWWWPTRVIQLQPDGKVAGNSYVHEWGYVEQERGA